MEDIIIFADGASKGNPGPGGWGAILVNDGVREIGGREEHTTNNRMELRAAIEALKAAAEMKGSIVFSTDSEYVIKGVTLWSKDWIRRGWKTAAKKPVLNIDLWKELLDQVEGRAAWGGIRWNHVRGHAGVVLNERTDQIASDFAEGVPVDLYKGTKSEYPIKL